MLCSQRPCWHAGLFQLWKIVSEQDPEKTNMKLIIFLLLDFISHTYYLQYSWGITGREWEKNCCI